MEHALPSVHALIDHQPVTAFQSLLFGDFAGGVEDVHMVALGGQGGEAGDLVAWHDQDMGGCLGIEVSKGYDKLIFVNDIAWNFPIYDLGKQCRHGFPAANGILHGFLVGFGTVLEVGFRFKTLALALGIAPLKAIFPGTPTYGKPNHLFSNGFSDLQEN